MCGEAMSEGMRADGFVDAILLGEFFHDEEDHLACEACATAVEENGVGEFGFRRDVQSGAFDVLEEDFQAAVADGHEPFLAAQMSLICSPMSSETRRPQPYITSIMALLRWPVGWLRSMLSIIFCISS